MSIAAAHYSLGVTFEADGAVESAERSYLAALKADPNFAEARHAVARIRFNLGVEAHRTEAFGEAERRYRQVLEVVPDQEQARANLTVIAQQFEADDAVRALGCYRTALMLDGVSGEAVVVECHLRDYFNYGGREYVSLLERLDRRDEAIDYLKSLICDDPDVDWVYSRLEKMFLDAGWLDRLIAINDAAFDASVQRQTAALKNDSDRTNFENFLGRHADVDRSRKVFAQFSDLAVRDLAYRLGTNPAMCWFPDGRSITALQDTLSEARAKLAAPALDFRRKRLVAALLVRDEKDIVGDVIACLLNQGVDLVIVTDNGSKDGSRELLAELEGRTNVQVFDEPRQNYDQIRWVSRMVHFARDRYDADWVICADADEIWLADGESLPNAIAHEMQIYGQETRLLLCQQAVVFPQKGETSEVGYRPSNAGLVLQHPLRYLGKGYSVDAQYYRSLHKAIVRTDGFVATWYGNHYAIFDRPTRHALAQSIRLQHHRVRTQEQMRNKITMTWSAMADNADWVHRHHGRSDPTGTADALFVQGSYPTPFLEHMRSLGRLVGVDERVPGIRDRALPRKEPGAPDADGVRNEAMAYFAAIEPEFAQFAPVT